MTLPPMNMSTNMFEMLLNLPLPAKGKDVQNIEWQLNTSREIIEKLTTRRKVGVYTFEQGLHAVMLRGGTGIGKMYICCEVIRQMAEKKLFKQPTGSNNPYSVVWVLPSNILIQTQRVVAQYGLSHLVHLMTYATFRDKRKHGNPYVEWIDAGGNEEEYVPRWRKDSAAPMYIIDECQNLRNPQTSTTQVAIALSALTATGESKVVLASATPAQRLCEARAMALLKGIVTQFNSLPLTNETFPSVMGDIAAHGKTMYDYSPKSMRNYRTEADLWYVEPKNVRFKFPAKTELLEIDLTPEKRQIYDDAYAEYLRKIWEEEKRSGPQGMLAKWVALGKFQEKAELLRADNLADLAVNEVKSGRQVIIGSKYVNTLRAIWTHLTRKLGVDSAEIAFVVGGQDKNKRQVNIDAFQLGAAKYMLLMMKAGGVGLSLHHDRVSPHSWPRTVILPPTYAAPELVQVLGRGHRLTSLSPTIQKVIWFRDTVESKNVLPKVKTKLRCLDAAVVAKEQWGHMLEAAGEAAASEEEYEEAYATSEKHSEPTDNDEVGSDDTEFITGEGLNNEE